ncbi:MAG: hypothetical protein LQ339_002873 [Xanthoria mediterranea]|nr:MAG: hypothetical protein LQ339_002873 [Xanthoria mediterranea]
MSLRHKLSKLWGQDAERPASNHRRSSSDAKFELTMTLGVDAQPIASPQTLRKAASTTFQAFSNSLRSRARTFYSTPNQDEASLSASPEPQTPKKTGHVSAVLSSVRGRGSRRTRSALKDTLGTLDGPETPTKAEQSSHDHLSCKRSSLDSEQDHSSLEYTPIGDEPPRISTEIPRSTLEDSLHKHDGDRSKTLIATATMSGLPTKHSQPTTTPVHLHSERKQLWPSPHLRLRGMTLVEQASPEVTQVEVTSEGLSHVSSSKSRSAAIDPAIADSDDQASANGQGGVEELSGSMLQNTAKGSPVFECERNSSEDFTGTFWPAGKVLKSSKRSSTEEGNEICAEAGMGPRDPWDKAQADRRKRHAALQSMHTASGDDPDRECLPINSQTLLSDPDTQKGLSRALDQLAQSSTLPPLLPSTQHTDSEEHLKVDSKGFLESSATKMTKKVKIVPSISSLHAQSSDTELPGHLSVNSLPLLPEPPSISSLPQLPGPLSIGSLHAEGSDTEFPGPPSISSLPQLPGPLSIGSLHAEGSDTEFPGPPSISSLHAECSDTEFPGSPPSVSSLRVECGDTEPLSSPPITTSLHAKSSDTEIPGSPPSVSSLNVECGDTEGPSSPSNGFNSAEDSSYNEYKTNKTLIHETNERVASPTDPWCMLNYENRQDSSNDADESDSCDSSSDIVDPTPDELRRAAGKSIEGFTGSCGKYARYTSTPTPSSPSNSPPREFGKVYVKTYESNGRSGSPSDPAWCIAHHERVEAYIAAQSRKYMAYADQEVSDWPPGQQQATRDQRDAYLKRAIYETLCQFIYRCEQESADEADAEDLAAGDNADAPDDRNEGMPTMPMDTTES